MAVAMKWGTYEEVADLAGMTIAEVRSQFQEAWNIEPGSPGLVNAKQEHDDYVLQDGQKLEFIKSETKWE